MAIQCITTIRRKLSFDTANWRGQNLLGFALMEVRWRLKEAIDDKS